MDSGVAVVIPARNEEMFLGLTLEALQNQTITPEMVVVVNDGSVDATKRIALQHGADVIDLEDRGYSVQGYPVLAEVVNHGLEKIRDYHNKNTKLSHVMVLGADHLLPKHYLDAILNEMSKDNLLAICSGQIKGERSVVPRGSGRVVSVDFWKRAGFCYPKNYGFETYLLIKAQQMGFRIKVLDDLMTETQRKTGKNYKNSSFISYGKSLRALGYSGIYSAARIGLLSIRNPKGGYYMLKGYMSNDVNIYDPELRSYLSSIQHKRIKRYLINPVKSFGHSDAA